MQPPIQLGTVLQNRYRIIKVLGQGGFGRTYLAEDLGRFNELCALKELIPSQTGDYALEKSKELFQREAAILYQIQHPQVPQFRATFEQDQRLFLVQDYVEGKTYRSLLDERRAVNQTFTEAEVLQLLRQLLPVLAHLHIRGIIHRDISPDNIILRNDAKPVLIDFGVVKELATRFQSPNITPQPTTVGKLGYAPSEQIQTGRAYPSSDLYALAVTCVVLLTSREPQELFDDTAMIWNWQRWATVSPGLAQVLNRMLSYKPSDRYQSVADVAKALQGVKHQVINQNNLKLPTLTRQVAAPELSQIQTIAISRRPDLVQSNTNNLNQPAPVIPAPKTKEIWDNPWAIAAIAIIVALFAGVGSWAIVSYILAQRPVPQTFPSPIVSESSTPTPTVSQTPTPTPSSEPINYSQRLNLVTGETTNVEGNLKANTTIDYIFRGEQGQQLTATLAQEGVLFTVLAPNQEPINDLAQRVTRYQDTLPFTGDYTIRLSPVESVEESKYQLNLNLENPVAPTPTETITPTPTPTISPSFEVELINFNVGETRQISGQTSPQQIKRYLVNVQQGQILYVAVQAGEVTLDIRNPDGEVIENAANTRVWQEQVQSSGEYQIDVITNQEDTDFTLGLGVRNSE